VIPRRRPLLRADFALAFNTLIWGSTFVVVKQALADVSPFLFLALRFSLAAGALVVLFRRSWSHPRGLQSSLRGGVFTGIWLFGGYAFQTVGLRLTTPSKSAFLTGLSTVMVPLLAALVYRIRPSVVELGGVGLATAGMGLMTLESARWTMARGDLLTICCAAAFAAHILSLGHYASRVSFEVLSLAQIGTAAVLALGSCWWLETPRVSWRPSVWVAIAVTGLLATALAFTIQAWAQQYTTPTRTALIFTLEPVFAWVTSFLLTGETLSPRAAAGAGAILAGIVLVELKPFRRELHPSQ